MSAQTTETRNPLDCRIATLTHYLPPYMARVLYHISREVREMKILLSIDQEPNRDFGNTWDGLDVSVQNSWMIKRPWKHSTGFVDELYVHVPYDTGRQLKAFDPDIVFSYELGFRSLASSFYCRRHRKPLVLCVCVSEHSEQGRGRLRHWLRKRLLRSASAITFNGPSCRRYLKRFDVPDEKLFHFPYCTSDSFRYEGAVERASEIDHRFICIGQLSERKGVLPLLDGISDYCRSRPHAKVGLDLVGNGPLHDKIANQERPSNFDLRLLGHMQYDQMCNAMEQAGVLVFPTMADEWGLVVNEGMQAGLPILGSCYGQAATTLIEPGKNGWLYKPDQVNELHQRLDEILSLDHAALTAMRHTAQETVRDITPQSVASGAIEMFKAVLANRSQHPHH
ncbi:MAG: glycosyltransferase family 4 protein [Aureliella sp.]